MEIVKIGDNLNHHITVCAKALQKIHYLLDHKYNKEFTVFMHCDRNKETGEYFMYDTFIPRQDNTSTTTECDSEDVMDLITEGADISKLGAHMHSHVSMKVFTSGTDERDILERAAHAGYNAAIIMNKNHDIFGHIVDIDLGIYLKNVDVYIRYPEKMDYENQMLKLIKKEKSLDKIKDLLTIDEWDFFTLSYPLEDSVKEDLEKEIKTKFKSKATVVPMGKSNYSSKPVYENGYDKDWYKEWYKEKEASEEAEKYEGYNPSLFKSEDDYVDYLMTADEQSMTDAEYRDYQKIFYY